MPEEAPSLTPTNEVSTDAFMSELQNRLLSQSNIISSADSDIEKTITSAIAGVKTSAEKSGQRIESVFNREKEAVAEVGGRKLTTAQEGRRGFATNTATLRLITEETNKDLKDLEQRKQELILAGDAEAAGKVAELQLKALTFKQESQQRVFTNLLSMGNFALGAKSEERLTRAQNMDERNKIAEIALEFGLPVSENDTLDTIIAKAAPFAGEERKLRLAQLRAETARAQAETAKALKGDQFDFDEMTAEVMASTINQLVLDGKPDQASTLLATLTEQYGPKGLELVSRKQKGLVDKEYSDSNLRTFISEGLNKGRSKGEIMTAIEGDPLMTPKQKEQALELLDEMSNRNKKKGKTEVSLFTFPYKTNPQAQTKVAEAPKTGGSMFSFTAVK